MTQNVLANQWDIVVPMEKVVRKSNAKTVLELDGQAILVELFNKKLSA